MDLNGLQNNLIKPEILFRLRFFFSFNLCKLYASKIKKAIFPIAGLGSRFLPATKTLAKEMLIIVLDRPILEWAVIEAATSGIEEMIFVTSSKKNSIIEHFNRSIELENLLKKKKKNNQLIRFKVKILLENSLMLFKMNPKGLDMLCGVQKDLLKKMRILL